MPPPTSCCREPAQGMAPGRLGQEEERQRVAPPKMMETMWQARNIAEIKAKAAQERAEREKARAEREYAAREKAEADVEKLKEQLNKAKARPGGPTQTVDLLSGLLLGHILDALTVEQVRAKIAALEREKHARKSNETAQHMLAMCRASRGRRAART
jgi:hypothetical protein